MACAFAAHADVVPASTGSTSAGFLSGWTTGSGASVIGSGVLSGNVNLVGGIAYGAGTTSTETSSGSLADALIDKASNSLGAAGGKTELYYSKGIEGVYLLGRGHGILAAMLGDGVSVVGSNNGVVVSQGSTGAQSGTGAQGGGSTGGTDNASSGGSGGSGSTGSGGTGSGSTGDSTGAAIEVSAGGNTSTGGKADPGGATGSTGIGDVAILIEEATATGGSGTGALPAGPAAVLPAAANVPEPSTIALMLAGVLGAGVLKRRRSR
jgi:hypothetical protein